MASGFVQRWKGKVTADSMWLRGWAMGEVQTTTPAAGSTLTKNFNTYVLSAASAAVVYTLPPVQEGVDINLVFASVSSAIFVKAATSPVNTFGTIGAGGVTALVLKSTAQMTVNLVGLSSVAWAVQSVWSTYSTAAALAQPVFSTTT